MAQPQYKTPPGRLSVLAHSALMNAAPHPANGVAGAHQIKATEPEPQTPSPLLQLWRWLRLHVRRVPRDGTTSTWCLAHTTHREIVQCSAESHLKGKEIQAAYQSNDSDLDLACPSNTVTSDPINLCQNWEMHEQTHKYPQVIKLSSRSSSRPK